MIKRRSLSACSTKNEWISQNYVIAMLMMKLLLTLFGLLWVTSAISTSSDITEENYLVWPPLGEGGTFYLHSEHSETHRIYSRKGYIQAMMPIYINMKEEKECRSITEPGSRGEIYDYCKFIGANGVFGFIKENYVRSIESFEKEFGEPVLLDDDFNHIVVPNDPTSEIIIYNLESDGSVKKIDSFSRSAAKFVVTTKEKSEKTAKIKDDAEDAKIALQEIRFWQLQAEGNNKYKKRTAYIKIDEENIPFIVLPAKVEVDSEMKPVSDITEENYLVWPPLGDGGTFYLHSEHSETHRIYSRKGYIQAMMPIYINMKEEKECRSILEPGSRGKLIDYCKFISANGVFGFIKEKYVKSIWSFEKEFGEPVLLDDKFNHIVVPNDPASKTIIYSLENDESVKEIDSFSRSSAKFVVTTKEKSEITVKIKDDAEDAKIALQEIRFWQPQAEGNNKYKKRTAYIKIDEENIPFIVLPAKVEVDSEMKSVSVGNHNNSSDLSCLTHYKERAGLNNKNLLKKRCRDGVEIIRVDAGASFKLDFKIIEFVFEGNLSNIPKSDLPINERYDISLYSDQLLNDDNIISFCKTIICDKYTGSDMHASTVVVGGSLLGKDSSNDKLFIQEVLHSDFLTEKQSYFKKVNPQGNVNATRAKIMALAVDDPKQKDYFTAFSKLSKYLTKILKKDDNPAESSKYVRITPLLIEEIVDF